LFANKTDALFSATRDTVLVGNPIDTTNILHDSIYLDFLGASLTKVVSTSGATRSGHAATDTACSERRTISVSAAYFLSMISRDWWVWSTVLSRQLRTTTTLQ